MLQALLYSNTATALAAAGWTYATLHTLRMPLDTLALLLSYLLVQSLYIRDRISDSEVEDDSVNVPARSLWLQQHRGMLKVLMLVEGVFSCLLICRRPPVLFAIVPGMLVVWLYTAKVLSGGRSLKQLPGQKSFYCAGLWNLLCIWIPVCFSVSQGPAISRPLVALVSAMQYCIDASIINLCDLRDMEGDIQSGSLTLPVLVGRRAARGVSIGLAVVVVVLGVLCGTPGQAATGLYVVVLSVLYEDRRTTGSTFTVLVDVLVEATGLFAGIMCAALA